jgi:hypothetical protein
MDPSGTLGSATGLVLAVGLFIGWLSVSRDRHRRYVSNGTDACWRRVK